MIAIRGLTESFANSSGRTPSSVSGVGRPAMRRDVVAVTLVWTEGRVRQGTRCSRGDTKHGGQVGTVPFGEFGVDALGADFAQKTCQIHGASSPDERRDQSRHLDGQCQCAVWVGENPLANPWMLLCEKEYFVNRPAGRSFRSAEPRFVGTRKPPPG